MPRVLYLFEYPTLHGGEHSLLAVLDVLREGGFQPAALAPAAGDLMSALRERGVEVTPWELFDERRVKRPLSELRQQLATEIARLRPELVHANSLSTSRLAGPVAAEAGVPSLGHLRDILSLSRQAIDDLNRHTRLLAVSAATRDWHIAQGLANDKVFVCYNGVDLERFRPRPGAERLHAELGLPPQAPLAGSIGQIGVRKGLDITAAAMCLLIPRHPCLHWVIVGERFSRKEEAVDYERRLRDEAARPPLAGRVHFLGVRRDVEFVLNELTVLIHAARQEPLGRVLLEAAATGLPVVAADVGGTAEIFPRPVFADVLIPPDNGAALAVRVGELLEDSRRRQAIGAQLRRRIETAFSARTAGQRLLEHYRAVLEDVC